ncbi:RnfH family protein [Halomonas sp. DQ26W]|uniref:RnfH family protein n=1 Tax=Halomonas sp. DQ26W TaxID=2282311 RepID=UPI000DF777B3|nr:RnfH family protein [Halomonas sp. DQ26W]RDB42590.1 RnfH family protein [Halomonas sp. DQ26W]
MAASDGRLEGCLHVEVAFALPDRQRIVALTVAEGTTVRQAVVQAELARLFPEVTPETFGRADLGIFGKPVRDPDAQALREGDRVEVYRPLVIDPKAARAERAARTRQ